MARHDPKITVAQFIGHFAGLTNRSRRATIAEKADLQYKPLAVLLDGSGTALDMGRVRVLLQAMKDESSSPNTSTLGRLGKDWAAAALSELAQTAAPDLPGFAYHTITDDEFGVPYIWEVAFAQGASDQRRRLLVGQNFSPAIDSTVMLNGFLKRPGAMVWATTSARASRSRCWCTGSAPIARRSTTENRCRALGGVKGGT